MGGQEKKEEEFKKKLGETRKRAEGALRNSELRYRTLFEASTDAILLQTLTGRVIDCNASACKMFGYAKEELIGMTVADLMAEEVTKTLPQVISRELITGGAFVETVNRRKDGSIFPVEMSSGLATLGEEHFVIAYVRDISERKRAEDALREAEREKQSILDALTEHVVYQDAEMKILWANRAAAESVGLSREEVIGRYCYEMWGDGRRPCPDCAVEKALKTGRPHEGQRTAADGKVWLIRGYPVRDEKGEVHGTIEVTLEVTERVRTEELMRAQRDLGLALGEARSLEETLRLCFEAAIRVSGMDCGGIYLVDEKSGSLDLAFHQGLHPDFVRSVAHYDADSANARLVMCGEPVYTRHGELGFPLDESKIRERLRAIAVIPVHYEHRVIACLNVASHTLEEVPSFSRTSLEAIAAQIGGVIARSKMQQALRESEERFRQIAETSPEAFWMISPNLDKVIYISPAYEKIWGRTCESLYEQPQSWLAAVHPGDRERVLARAERRAEGATGPEKTHTEYRILRPEGETRWIRSSASSILNERGEVCRLCGVAEDITELKRAEEAYRALVDHSLQGLLIVRESRILFANQAFADICGYTVDELLALSPEEVQALVHPDDQALVWGRHRNRLRGEGLPNRYEFRGIGKDSTIRWMEIHTSQIDYQGKPAVQAACVDITERKAAEETLRASEEGERQFSGQLKALNEIGNELSKVDSVHELCRIAVERGRSRLGFDRLSIWLRDQGNPDFVGGTWGVDEEGQLRDERGCRIAVGASEAVRALLLRKSPFVFFPDTPLYDGQGNTVGRGANVAAALWDGETVVGYVSADNLLRHHPITERHCELLTLYASTLGHLCRRKRGEEETRQLQEQLAQAQKMQALGTLAGGVAHEYNNILASVVGYTDLTLHTEELSDGARRNLEVVRSSAVRGADLTQSLLTFSRREVGKKKPVDLRAVVEEVLSVTGKEFSSEGIELTVEHSTRVPTVMGDVGMLRSVVMNLLINARHAMLKSKLKRLTIQTGLEKGKVFVKVQDTGCGIPKENLPRLFEPFFTTKGALVGGGIYDGKAGGTGLGLSVCHSIIEGHGGSIEVESQVGKGSSFVVYFPAASKRKTTRPETRGKPKASASRLLVVDDEEALVDLLVEMLGRFGYQVDGFTNPSEALRAAQEGEYSVAFVDLQMPEMAGEEFIERLNALPLEKRPVKVILTGRLIGSQEEYERLDVFATLSKPFSAPEVVEIIEKGLAARAGSTPQEDGETTAG